MLDQDKKILSDLVEQYSIQDILFGLVEASKNQADQLSDLGMSDKSKEMTKVSLILAGILEAMKK